MPTGKPYKPNEHDRLKLTHGLEFNLGLAAIAENMCLAVNTLKKSYPDVIEAAELKGDNSFRPTRDQCGLVMLAVAVGQRHEDVARMLGISRNTLRKHFAEELETGAAHANLKVGQNLFRMATGDPTLRSSLIAAIWWTKSRMGWRSNIPGERARTDGSRTGFQIVIVPPAEGRCAESVLPMSDPDPSLLQDAQPSPTGGDPCEQGLDIQLYQTRASHWRSVAAAISDMTFYAAFTEVARAYERLAFLATEAAKSAAPGPKRKPRIRG